MRAVPTFFRQTQIPLRRKNVPRFHSHSDWTLTSRSACGLSLRLRYNSLGIFLYFTFFPRQLDSIVLDDRSFEWG